MGEKNDTEHFLLDKDSVLSYVREKQHFFDKEAKLHAREIGDGNINYVFQIWDEKTGKSLVIKQADSLLRSSKRPLDLNRSKIEAEVLKIQRKLSKNQVPEVFFYDDILCAIGMEDISAYRNMRKELKEGKIFPSFSKEITVFLRKTLLPMTDLFLDRAEKKKMVKEFMNPELCDISEDLVFTEPYYDYKKRNVLTEGMEDFVKKKLYEDEELKAEVGSLRNLFMNKAETLIHGDLHTGSIFINENGIKIIDPEFAFYGPMGYDIGNVIGNLFFSLARDVFIDSRKEFVSWLKETIANLFDGMKTGLMEDLSFLAFPLYNSIFQEKYVDSVMSESLGFAGTEIIRRVVGDAKVSEMYEHSDLFAQKKMEKILIEMGIFLIKNRGEMREGREVIEAFETICLQFCF